MVQSRIFHRVLRGVTRQAFIKSIIMTAFCFSVSSAQTLPLPTVAGDVLPAQVLPALSPADHQSRSIAYDRLAAVQWALAYYDNPEIGSGQCTGLVGGAMAAGGISGASQHWVGNHQLLGWMEQNPTAWVWEWNISALQPGDIALFSYLDWNAVQAQWPYSFTHSALITTVTAGGNRLVSQWNASATGLDVMAVRIPNAQGNLSIPVTLVGVRFITDSSPNANRIAFLRAGELIARGPVMGGTWQSLHTDVKAFQLIDDKVAILRNDNMLFVKKGDLAAPWVQIDGAAAFQISGNRIGFLRAGELVVRDGIIDGAWHSMNTGVKAFQLSGDAVAMLTSDNNLYVKAGNLDATWVGFSGNVSSFQLDGNRVGFLRAGELLVRQGIMDGAWQSMQTNVKAFQLAGDTVAILKNDGKLFVKKGDLAAAWVEISGNVSAFQVDGNRIGFLRAGELLVREGIMDGAWHSMNTSVRAFQLAGSTVAILMNNHDLFVKQGDLASSWEGFSGDVSTFQLASSVPRMVSVGSAVYSPVFTVEIEGEPVSDEGNPLSFVISVKPTSPLPVTVDLSIAGTASTADYAALTNPITIPAKNGTYQLSIPTTDDHVPETDETLVVTLIRPNHAVLGPKSSAIGTIYDNDEGQANLLTNGSFETAGNSGGPAQAWKGSNLLPKDKRKCGKATKPLATIEGNCVFQFQGGSVANPARKVKQVVVSTGWGNIGETLTISAQAAGKKFEAGARIQVKVVYSDNTVAKQNVAIQAGTYTYVEHSGSLLLTKPVKKIIVKFDVKTVAGKLHVDDIWLLLTDGIRSGSRRELPASTTVPETFRGSN